MMNTLTVQEGIQRITIRGSIPGIWRGFINELLIQFESSCFRYVK